MFDCFSKKIFQWFTKLKFVIWFNDCAQGARKIIIKNMDLESPRSDVFQENKETA